MPTTPGARFGPYEVIALLGQGGMGEVYRARDLSLNREVALKILPDAFNADAERVARFRREAQVLASLNHPHIAAIYGLEEIEGSASQGQPSRALVLELVEGETLAARLRHGRLPIAEALALARQVADALEAAHERGIIHRDLKPGNLIVTSEGVVKVLDFGLAKVMSADALDGDSSHSPTLTAHGTRQGVILGTAAYMSPEQAKGRVADKRADLWAFGAVVYEMMTGHKAFEGDDVSTILAHILTKEPEWNRLPTDVPASVVRMLRRCLTKDRKGRLDSAAVARLEIDEALAPSAAQAANAVGKSRRAIVWATGAALAAAVATFGVTRATMRPASPKPETLRFAITLPSSQKMPAILLDRDLAISPDGRYVVYRVGGSSMGGGALALRGLDELEGRLLPGIDNARAPFFSPDGRWIGFFAGSGQGSGFELKKISTAGGAPITIAKVLSVVPSASWPSNDSIVIADTNGRLLQVAAAGGAAPVALPAQSNDSTSAFASSVSLLPGGRGALMTVRRTGTWFTEVNDSQVTVLDLQTGQRKVLVRGSAPNYVAVSTAAGYLLYVSGGTLFGVGFDLNRLAVIGDPVPLVEQIAMAPGGVANYDVSRTGSLIYVPAGAAVSRSLVWVDRAGRETATDLPARAYSFVRLSPDGRRVALTGLEDRRIWIGDLVQNTVRPLTLGSSEDGWPIWSADGRSIIFDSNRDGPTNLYSQPADGSGPAIRLTSGPNSQFPNSAAPGGQFILGAEFTTAMTLDVVLFQATSSRQTSGSPPTAPVMPFGLIRHLVKTPAIEYNAILSRDGRFFAYQSNESGRTEVYVKPFPMASEVRWQVSTSGGSSPLWAPSGRELYYRDQSNAVMAVSFEIGEGTWHGRTPVKMVDAKYAAPTDMFNYDMSPDGQRFLMLKDSDRGGAPPANLVVVLNWVEDLKQRVPTR